MALVVQCKFTYLKRKILGNRWGPHLYPSIVTNAKSWIIARLSTTAVPAMYQQIIAMKKLKIFAGIQKVRAMRRAVVGRSFMQKFWKIMIGGAEPTKLMIGPHEYVMSPTSCCLWRETGQAQRETWQIWRQTFTVTISCHFSAEKTFFLYMA